MSVNRVGAPKLEEEQRDFTGFKVIEPEIGYEYKWVHPERWVEPKKVEVCRFRQWLGDKFLYGARVVATPRDIDGFSTRRPTIAAGNIANCGDEQNSMGICIAFELIYALFYAIFT